MDENAVKMEMRLFVMETLISLLFVANHQASGRPEASFRGLRDALLEKARRQTFAGLDPTFSDLAASELEDAVERAMRLQAPYLGLEVPRNPR